MPGAIVNFGSSNNSSPNVSRNSSFNSGKASPRNYSPRGSFSKQSGETAKSTAQGAAKKSNTLPVITSTYKSPTASMGKSQTKTITSSYTWKTGSALQAKTVRTTETTIKTTGNNNKASRTEESTKTTVTKTSSQLQSIPKVKDRMKVRFIKLFLAKI